MKKKFAEIADKTVDVLLKEIGEAKIELLNLRMQHARSALKNPILLREKRKLIARMYTVVTMKKQGVSNG